MLKMNNDFLINTLQCEWHLFEMRVTLIWMSFTRLLHSEFVVEAMNSKLDITRTEVNLAPNIPHGYQANVINTHKRTSKHPKIRSKILHAPNRVNTGSNSLQSRRSGNAKTAKINMPSHKMMWMSWLRRTVCQAAANHMYHCSIPPHTILHLSAAQHTRPHARAHTHTHVRTRHSPPPHLCVPHTQVGTRARWRHRPTRPRPLASGARSLWSCPSAHTNHRPHWLMQTVTLDTTSEMRDMYVCEDWVGAHYRVHIVDRCAQPCPKDVKQNRVEFVQQSNDILRLLRIPSHLSSPQYPRFHLEHQAVQANTLSIHPSTHQLTGACLSARTKIDESELAALVHHQVPGVRICYKTMSRWTKFAEIKCNEYICSSYSDCFVHAIFARRAWQHWHLISIASTIGHHYYHRNHHHNHRRHHKPHPWAQHIVTWVEKTDVQQLNQKALNSNGHEPLMFVYACVCLGGLRERAGWWSVSGVDVG